MRQGIKRTYSFTLILSGRTELTEEIGDALFEAGCDDALLGVRDGILFLDFRREAPSFREAVLSAIRDVESADFGIQVMRVEPDELVTIAEIARRAKRSRENIRQFITGLRGPGGFPPPLANLTRKSAIWRWTDVAQWLKDKEAQIGVFRSQAPAATKPKVVDEGAQVAALNALLELRRHFATTTEAMEIFKRLQRSKRRPQTSKS